MKPKKMSLKEIQGVLSRDEMKKIIAGSGGSDKCNSYCSSNSDCDSECSICDPDGRTGGPGGKICVAYA